MPLSSPNVRDFLADISHELRTPLTSILGFAGLLGRETALSEADQKRVALIREGGLSLLALVNDILDFSKLDAGHAQLAERPFSVRALVESVTASLEPQAQAKGLSLQCRIEGEETLVGDEARLRQVLVNLVGNALKFTSTGGVRIEATAAPLADGRMMLQARVEDTGVGLSAAEIARLFARFVQADATIERRFGGTGLGLSISRRIIELMGGEIGARSDGHSGSVFWFRTPLPAHASETAEVHAPAATTLKPDLRLLLVDDHAANRVLIQTLLGCLDLRLDLAASGEAALEAAGRTRYDLILMDVQMPIMDGLSATRLIRASGGPCREAPILALTADTLPRHIEACAAAGMQGHLAKPIDPAALIAAIHRHATAAAPQAGTIHAA